MLWTLILKKISNAFQQGNAALVLDRDNEHVKGDVHDQAPICSTRLFCIFLLALSSHGQIGRVPTLSLQRKKLVGAKQGKTRVDLIMFRLFSTPFLHL